MLNILAIESEASDLEEEVQLAIMAEKAVSSYILLLAVLQLPAVRSQLIPVLQQLGERFMEPLRLANTRQTLYAQTDMDCLPPLGSHIYKYESVFRTHTGYFAN